MEKLLSEFNLHTIVRLPNGVFSPYTGIRTNLLFFEKDSKGTKEIWYFEHPYPERLKSYSKTNPIKNQEFDLEKSWWNNRAENEYAWKVGVDVVVKNNFNLDIKNPNGVKKTEFESPTKILNDLKEIHSKSLQNLEVIKELLEKSYEI